MPTRDELSENLVLLASAGRTTRAEFEATLGRIATLSLRHRPDTVTVIARLAASQGTTSMPTVIAKPRPKSTTIPLARTLVRSLARTWARFGIALPKKGTSS